MFDPMEVILNSTGALVYVIDVNTYEILYANERCKEEFGEITGKVCYKELQRDQYAPCNFCPLYQYQEESNSPPIGTIFEWENQNSINNRHYMFVERIIEWRDGRTVKVQIGIDITIQKTLEKEILKEKDNAIDLFETIIDSTIEGLIIYNDNNHCIRVNGVATKLFGYTREEMIGQNVFNFIAPSSHDLVKEVVTKRNQDPYKSDMLRKDGSTFSAILRGKDLVLAGEKIRISAVLDITDIKKKEKEILRLAHYDSLTELPNRLLLKELLGHMIKRNMYNSYYGALLFIDLDHFKIVNDTKGHGIGDMVLIETAKRIQTISRQTDIVARLGGDEFVVAVEPLLTDKDSAITNISIMAKKILEELQKPYLIADNDFRLTASIGIVQFNDDYHSIDELMKFADSAMYNAKENGRNEYQFFDPKLQQMMEIKALLIERLRKSIHANVMFLYYQPQIMVVSRQQIVGVEALIRWNDPQHGMISPASFIPIAEECGLIIPLGEWILREAMQQLKRWESDSIKKEWRISFNVSFKQFETESFVSLLKSMVNEYKIISNKLRLELTESLLIKNTEVALDKINMLKDMGFSLSIDDFGTGYSSLSYLKQLPIDELKIDQSFIRDLVIDHNDFIIVETILSIGRKFNLEVIAEGVETHEQYEKLLSMGCKYFQGYLFGKPVKEEKLLIESAVY